MSSKFSGKKCIFCDGYGLTKQHVWPDWLKNVLPKESNEHIQFITRLSLLEPHKVALQPEFIKKQGHQGSRKIRNVCGQCNGGWMSVLENKAKPILSSLIRNEKILLDVRSQEIIAAWAVMTSIMGEFTDIKTAAIPSTHRRILMETKKPPEGWKIWIGWYRGEQWKQRLKHTGASIILEDQLGVVKPEFNTQSTTLVMGELIIYAASSTFLNFDVNFEKSIDRRLRCIWPSQENPIAWPPKVILADIEADYISDMLMNNGFVFNLK